MGHNSVVSCYPKSTGIPRVDWVVNGTLEFWGVTGSHIYIFLQGFVEIFVIADLME